MFFALRVEKLNEPCEMLIQNTILNNSTKHRCRRELIYTNISRVHINVKLLGKDIHYVHVKFPLLKSQFLAPSPFLAYTAFVTQFRNFFFISGPRYFALLKVTSAKKCYRTSQEFFFFVQKMFCSQDIQVFVFLTIS